MERPADDIDRGANLIWIDLEMTGLDTTADTIIEIATIVTDKHLNELAEGPVLAIAQPRAVMDGMDEWNTTQHGESGLRTSLGRVERPPDERPDAERSEVARLDPRGADPIGLAFQLERHGARVRHREVLERSGLCPGLGVDRGRVETLVVAERSVGDDESVALADGERPPQQGVADSESRRRGSDADGE